MFIIFFLIVFASAGFSHQSTLANAPKCGPDEEFRKYCRGGHHGITKCSEYLDEILDKPEHSCTQGCVCTGSKLRDASGKCIESNDCPELHRCQYDPHAMASCKRFSEKRCPNHPQEPDSSDDSHGCDKNGCECIPPYLYDSQTRICVEPETCSKVCGPEEVFFDDCVGAGCQRTQCYQPDLNYCIDVVPSACVRGCVCANGKVRTQNGTCVLPEDCPPRSEEYCRYPYSRPGCGANCGRRCNDSKPCTEECKPKGCDCIPPFVYDEFSDECTPTELCEEIQKYRTEFKEIP